MEHQQVVFGNMSVEVVKAQQAVVGRDLDNHDHQTTPEWELKGRGSFSVLCLVWEVFSLSC